MDFDAGSDAFLVNASTFDELDDDSDEEDDKVTDPALAAMIRIATASAAGAGSAKPAPTSVSYLIYGCRCRFR
jgi:hypothetical protein